MPLLSAAITPWHLPSLRYPANMCEPRGARARIESSDMSHPRKNKRKRTKQTKATGPPCPPAPKGSWNLSKTMGSWLKVVSWLSFFQGQRGQGRGEGASKSLVFGLVWTPRPHEKHKPWESMASHADAQSGGLRRLHQGLEAGAHEDQDQPGPVGSGPLRRAVGRARKLAEKSIETRWDGFDNMKQPDQQWVFQ